jgi:hypothetical protein
MSDESTTPIVGSSEAGEVVSCGSTPLTDSLLPTPWNLEARRVAHDVAVSRVRETEPVTDHKADARGATSFAPCPICLGVRTEAFRGRVLGRYDVTYLSCSSCGLVQTEEPYWLEEAYSKPIAALDTGILERTLVVGRALCALYGFVIRPSGAVLDYAGGYGLLTRYLRDRGFDCYWTDPFTPNLLARGFEVRSAPTRVFDSVSAVEVIEHVMDPGALVDEVFDKYGARTLVLTTELAPADLTSTRDWWYVVPDTGQHISLYQRRTLEVLAETRSLRFHTRGTIHLVTKERYGERSLDIALSRVGRAIAAMSRRRRSFSNSDHVLLLARGASRQR